MNIQIDICQCSIPVQDAEKSIAFAAQLGLEGVEPDLGSYEQGFPLSHAEEQAKYRAWRERLGIAYPALAVNALCQYGMSVAASRPIAEMAIARTVETAVALDIPIVQLPIDNTRDGHIRRDVAGKGHPGRQDLSVAEISRFRGRWVGSR